jgi:sugar phosphate isomerase/epimerase
MTRATPVPAGGPPAPADQAVAGGAMAPNGTTAPNGATATAGPAASGDPTTSVGGGAMMPAVGGVTAQGKRFPAASGLRRFSFNQATTQGWALPDLVDALVRAGVSGIGLWREPVAEYGLAKTARLVREVGLEVTSLCRGGFFADAGWYDENRRAVDEAAELGTSVLVLVSGGLGGRDLAGARAHVADAVGRLVPHARAAGVTLAIEALHPMFCSDRCVISTLEQALTIAERHEVGEVGVVIDTYHLWWDDRAPALVRRAGARVSAFQLADWITPLPEGVLTGRGMPGTGCVDLPAWVSYVDSAGYTGPIEIEVFNTEVWARPGEDVLAEAVAGYRAAVAASTT